MSPLSLKGNYLILTIELKYKKCNTSNISQGQNRTSSDRRSKEYLASARERAPLWGRSRKWGARSRNLLMLPYLLGGYHFSWAFAVQGDDTLGTTVLLGSFVP